MEVWQHFFLHSGQAQAYLPGHYNSSLVWLSLLVSVFSATMALQIAHIARQAERQLYRNVAIFTGAIALGGGVWTMHFIGMLAFELPTHVHYSTPLTLMSLLPACAASWLALRLLADPEFKRSQLLMSGALVGLGIGVMHYTGMAAMETGLQMRYDPIIFGLSIVLAVGLATLALWIRYGLRKTKLSQVPRQLLSGLIMGLAIAGMHYTGMAAIRFIGEPGPAGNGLLLSNTFASLILAAFTIVVTVMVYAFNGLIRSRELYLKVEESKSRLRAILDTAVDGIITIDSLGLIQSFNHSAERLFGWTAAEVIGRNIKILMPEPDQTQHDTYLTNYLTSGQPKIIGSGREVLGLRKDGSLMPMRLAVGRVDLPGELLFVGFVTDVSQRHALEASLRETAEQAEKAAAAKSTFLANMSHEIRTPMNSIIGFTELLLQGDLTSDQRTQLRTIRQSSRWLLRLINDILDTTRMEKGHLELEHIDFSLKGLAMQIESSLRIDAQSKHLSLSTHYPVSMPEYFRGDPLRVLQILTNLVGNAIKFTESGAVEVIFAYTDGKVRIEVCDTGIGMTQQQAESIFAPFTQADNSISRRFGGTGLGTTIARQLVDLMGGHIDVESELGRGSVFRVHLPLTRGQPPATPITASGEVTLPSLNILIADDVAQNLELLSLTLEGHGHKVTAAHDGAEAVERFTHGQFDIVLMDVHMPGTDGLQATQIIRQYERSQGVKSTPIIALTASVMAEDRQAATQAGMNGFAIKPLELGQLFREMARVLQLQAPTTPPGTQEQKPTTASSPLIDWRGGLSLWGNTNRLSAALQQFLARWPSQHPLPSPDAAEIDWDKAIVSLHGIRGAAGNLAMPKISAQAAALETDLRAGRLDNARTALAALLADLQAAEQELRAAQGHTTSQPEKPSPSANSPDSLEELKQNLSALQTLLTHNELDDAVINKACASLEANGLRVQSTSLRTSLEAFEFHQAQALITQLLDHLSALRAP